MLSVYRECVRKHTWEWEFSQLGDAGGKCLYSCQDFGKWGREEHHSPSGEGRGPEEIHGSESEHTTMSDFRRAILRATLKESTGTHKDLKNKIYREDKGLQIEQLSNIRVGGSP